MTDSIYTPPFLAKYMVDQATLANAQVVADFAMGDGALLAAAKTRWPNASIVGNDLDPMLVPKVLSLLPDAQLSSGDFLDESVRGALAHFTGGCDCVLLNPPFSQRSGPNKWETPGGVTVKVGKAMTFVVAALDFISKSGELIAVLPSSVLTSQRDEPAWSLLWPSVQVDVIREPEPIYFGSRRVSVAVVRFSRRPRPSAPPKVAELRSAEGDVVVVHRGSLPMHRARVLEGPNRLVHTTELRNGQLLAGPTRVSWPRSVQGMGIFIPRVGKPNQAKIILSEVEGPIVLSDCVIHLQAGRRQLEAMRSVILADWSGFSSLYSASCAPYVTLSQLGQYFGRHGHRLVSERVASAELSVCDATLRGRGEGVRRTANTR